MKILESIIIPQDTANDDQVIIRNINVTNNELIESDHCCIDYETSKATFEITNKKAGYVKLFCKEDDVKKIGELIIEIYDSPINDEDIKISETDEKNKNETIFSKSAIKKIDDLGLSKDLFEQHELVTEEIVVNWQNKNLSDNNEVSNFDSFKIDPSKKTEIYNLTNSERVGLISTVSKTIDCNDLNLESIYNNKEFKGSLSPILIKIISQILSTEKYRHLNSYCDGESVHIYKNIDFGVALNLGSGLKVGVIRNSNKNKLEKIENEFISLIDKYIDGKLLIEDIKDPTIILTDLTESKIEHFSPLISKNNSLMIGLSGEKKGIQVLTISFDHRVTDGLEVSNFMNEIIKNLNETLFKVDEKSCFKCLKSIEEDNELDGPGLISIFNNGKVKLICKNCLTGW